MQSFHWCPDGYVPVVLATGVITHWLLSGISLRIGKELAPAQGGEWTVWIQADRKGDPVAVGKERVWIDQVQMRFGRALSYGGLPASGVLLTGGGLVRVPPAAWTVTTRQADGAYMDQFEMAILGRPISTNTQASNDCWPMVAKSDLAIWAGSSITPEAPTIVPTDEVTIKSPEITPNGETPVDGTMQGGQIGHPPALASAAPATGGRDPTHDWDAFWIEVVNWTALNIGVEGLRRSDRRNLQKHMEKWTSENPPIGGEAMVPPTVRLKLQRLFAGKP